MFQNGEYTDRQTNRQTDRHNKGKDKHDKKF